MGPSGAVGVTTATWFGAPRKLPPNRPNSPADLGVDAPLPVGVVGEDDDTVDEAADARLS